jgi:hypothetical protein
MKLFDFAHHADFCGDRFAGQSWDAHRVIWRLYDGDADLLTDAQKEIAYELLGCRCLPSGAPQELFVGAGRRCGKNSENALFSVHAAAKNYQKPEGPLDPGQWATAACCCPTRKQAKEWLNSCLGIIENSRLLASEVSSVTEDTIEFKHSSRLTVLSSNFRALRSYSLSCMVIDEAAYLMDEGSASPDVEVYRTARAGLATLKGPLIVTSSHHRKAGLMYDKYCTHYGKVA